MNVTALLAAGPERAGMRGMEPGLILAVCAVCALAIQSLFIPLDGDVSWLITVAERVLGGDRLYVDIFETNPPASVWLYVPQVWLAQALGLRPETVVVAIAAAMALLCAACTLRLARQLRRPPDPLLLAFVLGLATLILPGGLFAQREHYALLLAIPVLTGLALILEQGAIAARPALLAGLASGLIGVIKPHLLLAVLLPAAWVLLRRRTLRPFVTAASAAALVVFLYAAAFLILARPYFDYLPLLADAYLPVREHWTLLLVGPGVFVPVTVAVLALVARPREPSSLAVTLLLGMAGFALAALVQGKGYANHALPGTALGIAGLAVLLATSGAARERRILVGAALAALAATQLYTTHGVLPPPGLADAVRRVAPASPRMITLGTELVTGHPVVRLVDGRWAGSSAAMFTAQGVRYRRSGPLQAGERARLERWYRADLAAFARDVAANRPDVVLVEVAEKPWTFREPVLMHAVRDYRFAARAGEVEIWLRRDLLP